MSLKKSYLKHCKDKDLEINENQIKIVQKLSEYYNLNFGQSFIKKLFKDKKNKLGFYLVGDVGVGKTMILNFFFESLKEKKSRLHFNEFMVEFHDFIFENKKMNLKKSYLKHCKDKDLEINENQIKIVEKLNEYYNLNFNQSFIKKLFKDKKNKLGFYLVGDVGVGKTMILNFFFESLKEKKSRLHFNEFMVEFHDFIFENKKKGNDKGLEKFIKNLSDNTKILYFDEFQVTNIVDAMILGKLFERIFNENIKVIFSSNTNIKDLYKNGLQRDQFIPFLNILKNNCSELELNIEEDYRATKNTNLSRFLSPIDNSSNFKFNKSFRKATKNKKQTTKILDVKGRKLVFDNFHEGVLKVSFDEICNRNLGSEDYIKIANESDFIFIENLPNFNESNSNQQQRFITFIDIIYEKKIPLMIKSEVELNSLESTYSMKKPFKRTVSRLHELTSQNFN